MAPASFRSGRRIIPAASEAGTSGDRDFIELARRLSRHTPKDQPPGQRPRAAVALVLAPDPEAILLIRRAERDGDVWSGHVALPGGRAAPADPDLRATAARETFEEVGIVLPAEALIGRLDDLAPSSPVLPPIVVRPFVFRVPRQEALVPNREVAAATWIPLDQFHRPDVLRPTEHHRHGTLVRMPGYHLEFGVVWGLTERILSSFFAIVRSADITLTYCTTYTYLYIDFLFRLS